MSDHIGFYEKEFYSFSNFSAFAVEYDGRAWSTSEHAYQAMKFLDKDIQEKILEARSAHDAKKIAHEYQEDIRSDWDEVKVSIMEEIVRAKHGQHPYIQKKLKQTEEKEIIEDSPVDAFWGWGPSKDGQNNLGKIWMKIRKENNHD